MVGCDRCRRGWLGYDSAGRLIPCTVCRTPRRPAAVQDIETWDRGAVPMPAGWRETVRRLLYGEQASASGR